MFDYESKKSIEVTSCYHCCDFFESDMDGMFCSHPTICDQPRIINQDNSRGRVPPGCPLRRGKTKIVKIYNLREGV